MSETTTTDQPTAPTTPEATPDEIATLTAAVTTAEQAVTAAKANADAKLPALIKASNYGPEFAELSTAISKAQVVLNTAQDALRAARASSVWESMVAVRQPIVDAAREFTITSPITVGLTAVNGTITFDDEGAHVTLKPVIAPIDMSAIESLIAEQVDAAAFAAEKITSLDLNVTNIDKPDAMVQLVPSSSKTAATRNASGARTGKLEYEFNGAWLGSHELLDALEATNHQITVDRKQSFDTALRGNGNGMSNLAKSVAKALNINSHEVTALAA